MSAADAPADHILKIVIIGDGLVGKSSLMGVYTEGVQAFEEERKRTIGVDFKVRARPSPCVPRAALLTVLRACRSKSSRSPTSARCMRVCGTQQGRSGTGRWPRPTTAT